MDETELAKQSREHEGKLKREMGAAQGKARRSAEALGQDWRMEALCANSDLPLEYWFPETRLDRDTAAEAMEVCWECPVRLACLEHACLVPEMYGIFGGLGSTTRRDVLNKFDELKGVQNPFE